MWSATLGTKTDIVSTAHGGLAISPTGESKVPKVKKFWSKIIIQRKSGFSKLSGVKLHFKILKRPILFAFLLTDLDDVCVGKDEVMCRIKSIKLSNKSNIGRM